MHTLLTIENIKDNSITIYIAQIKILQLNKSVMTKQTIEQINERVNAISYDFSFYSKKRRIIKGKASKLLEKNL